MPPPPEKEKEGGKSYGGGKERGRIGGGDAENARHENAGLESAAQTCRLLQGVENAKLENVAQKYRAGKRGKGKCDTKPLRVENAGMEKAGK